MRVAVLIVLLAGAFLGLSLAGEDPRPEDDTIHRLPEDLARLRLRRHGHEVVRVGDVLYSFGGYGDAHDNGRVLLRYGLPDGPWERVGETPVSMGFFGAVAVGDDVYCVTEGLHRYRPRDGTWHSWPAAGRLPRSHHGVAFFQGRLYVLGGIPKATSRMWSVDLEDGSFEEAPPPPGFEPTDHLHVMVVAGGRLHVLGGTMASQSGLALRHASFDGVAWLVHPEPPAPLWRKFEAVGCVDGRIVVGGREATHVFDTRTNAWSLHAGMPGWIVMPACFVEDGKLIVVGGREVDAARGAPRAYAAMAFDPVSGIWTGDVR